MIDQIMAFENGELGTEGVISLFQALIDSGDAWRLQGSYGRMADHLIKLGECTP